MLRRSALARRSVFLPGLAATMLAGCGGDGLQVAGPAPNSSAAALTEIVGCARSEHAPARLQLRCTGPHLTLEHLRWHDWGGPTATASGTLAAAPCTGDDAGCATPATVTASNLVLSARTDQYRSLSVATGSGASRRTTHFDVDDRGPTPR